MDDTSRNAMRRLCLLNGSSAAEEAAALLDVIPGGREWLEAAEKGREA